MPVQAPMLKVRLVSCTVSMGLLEQARVLAALVTVELARRASLQAPGKRLRSAKNAAMVCCFP